MVTLVLCWRLAENEVTPRKYTVLSVNFVFDLHNFILRDVHQERIPGVKWDLLVFDCTDFPIISFCQEWLRCNLIIESGLFYTRVYHVLAECLNCVASFGNSTNFLKLGCFVCKISNFPIPVGARKNNLRWLAGMHEEEVRARNKKKSVVLPLCEQGQASAILHWKSVIAVFVIVKYLFPKL
jgi:Zn finger protein HypA/HybF involved in hydrogenase expression